MTSTLSDHRRPEGQRVVALWTGDHHARLKDHVADLRDIARREWNVAKPAIERTSPFGRSLSKFTATSGAPAAFFTVCGQAVRGASVGYAATVGAMTPLETSAIVDHEVGTRIVPNIGDHRGVVYARCFTLVSRGLVTNDPRTSTAVAAAIMGTRGKNPAVHASGIHL